MMTQSEYEHLTYETNANGTIVSINLNRPEVRNAQNHRLILELDAAFLRAEADDNVKVIILGGIGPAFSAGHDLSSGGVAAFLGARDVAGDGSQQAYHPSGASKPPTEARWWYEWEYFFANTRRWRDLKKITIAKVQGYCLAAGLMLAWSCDLIVAAEDAVFADIVGARLGICGVEYFAHPWEFGPRKAKELLLTGDSLDADEAHRLGMVSKVFPNDKLDEMTMTFAERIAARPSMTALLVKEAVNQTQDIQGFYNALKASFSLHQLNHAHFAEESKGERTMGWVDLQTIRRMPIQSNQKNEPGFVAPADQDASRNG